MKPARVELEHRDIKPANDRPVVITWNEETDPRRLRRIAEILADILDNKTTPGEGGAL